MDIHSGSVSRNERVVNWNHENRLSRLKSSGKDEYYYYNPDGQRVRKTNSTFWSPDGKQVITLIGTQWKDEPYLKEYRPWVADVPEEWQ